MKIMGAAVIVLSITACKTPSLVQQDTSIVLPDSYTMPVDDTITSADQNWHNYFHDANLVALIDSALANNQELNIMTQELLIAQNEVLARKGEYQPTAGVVAGAGADKDRSIYYSRSI